jgi:hypothetical protein
VERRCVVGTVATETDVRGLAPRRVSPGIAAGGLGGRFNQVRPTRLAGATCLPTLAVCIGGTGMDVHDGCGNENSHGVGVQQLQQVGRKYDEVLSLNWDTVPVWCGVGGRVSGH